MTVTDEQAELLRDKYVLWERASREGSMELRDYNRRAAEALKAALMVVADAAHAAHPLTHPETGAQGAGVEPEWARLIATEFAKPQFMTTTSGPGNIKGTRAYSIEFTFVGDTGERAEAARKARDDLEDAFRAAGKAINGAAS